MRLGTGGGGRPEAMGQMASASSALAKRSSSSSMLARTIRLRSDSRSSVPRSSSSSKQSTVSWEKTPTSCHSQLGQRSQTSQWVGDASSHSVG